MGIQYTGDPMFKSKNKVLQLCNTKLIEFKKKKKSNSNQGNPQVEINSTLQHKCF